MTWCLLCNQRTLMVPLFLPFCLVIGLFLPFLSLSFLFPHLSLLSHPMTVPLTFILIFTGFESVLRQHKEAIVGDKFINGYIPSLRRELQKRVFVELSRPYTNLRLPFVGKVPICLNLSPSLSPSHPLPLLSLFPPTSYLCFFFFSDVVAPSFDT